MGGIHASFSHLSKIYLSEQSALAILLGKRVARALHLCNERVLLSTHDDVN